MALAWTRMLGHASEMLTPALNCLLVGKKHVA
jgi:hypothetical protein